eukprot:g19894.t2
MSSFLIDTHCHVHVSLTDGSETAETGCCDYDASTNQQESETRISISGEGACKREARDDLFDKGDDSSDARSTMNPRPPEVVHVTMGIKEDDWLGAVRFGAAGAGKIRKSGAGHNLEHGGSNESPVAPVPRYFRFGLGLHPWNAHAKSEGWLQNLKALLEEYPQALVGEIGLDKVARTPDTRRVEWDHQLKVFRVQMALAARLSRPVSMHCVKAYGKIVDFLREAGGERPTTSCGRRARSGDGGARNSVGESGVGVGDGASGVVGGPQGCRVEGGRVDGGSDEPLECEAGRSPGDRRKLKKRYSDTAEGERTHRLLPPRIALHSFTGSVEVAKDIMRLGRGAGEGGVDVYFGFSAAVNMRGECETKRLIDILTVVPHSRILIETDRHVPVAAADELLRVCGAIAEAKGICVAEAAALANGNAALFLSELS